MNILVLYANKRNESAGWTETKFLEDFATECGRNSIECRLVGERMPDHIPGWGLKEYMRKYFRNNVDWIMGYNHPYPNWLSSPPRKPRPEGFSGRLFEWNYDMHVAPDALIEEANANIDLWLLRCTIASTFFPTMKSWFQCKGATPDEWIANGYCVQREPDYFTKQITTQYRFFPLTADATVFKPISQKDYDIAMVGVLSPFYPIRTAIGNEIVDFTKAHRLRLLFHVSPPDKYSGNIEAVLQNPALRKQYSIGPDYAERIAKSKMLVFCSGFAKAPIAKYFEGMMAGTAVVADTPANAAELHFEPDRNFISIDASNWKDEILYYLDNTQDREEIALRGRETAMKYHTNRVRAKELIAHLKGASV